MKPTLDRGGLAFKRRPKTEVKHTFSVSLFLNFEMALTCHGLGKGDKRVNTSLLHWD
ncbi:hypothetical protein QJS10_CPA02g00991 [Acorus calamus]|uniref:Uncharacterized protein n=1 Tax=Acorus calamus TaxID=4465 RepID=A0AAV9FA51_ACOCL|nr:hypothetical protein QJS10_CPA02g00991 [Acorus calamus]